MKTPEIRFKFSNIWDSAQLGDKAKIKTGAGVTDKETSDNFKYPVISGGKEIMGYYSKPNREANTITVARAGTAGYVQFIKTPFYLNDKCFSVIPNKDAKLTPVFLFYLLKNKEKYIMSLKSSTSVPTINTQHLNSLLINIPEDLEQQKIGNFFSNIDNQITKNEQKLKKLKQLKQSFLQKMFTKEGEDVPKIRFKGFEGEWEEKTIDERGTFYYGKSCPKRSVSDDAPTPCIRYGELYTKFGNKIDKVISHTNIDTEKLRFSKGTEVLVPRVGEDPWDYTHCTRLSIANVAIGEMISVYNTEQNPLFTATMFNATLRKEFAIRVEGGSVTNLYYEKLKNIKVRFPKKEEQEKIALFFEKLDKQIHLQNERIEKLNNLKQSLLQKMFI